MQRAARRGVASTFDEADAYERRAGVGALALTHKFTRYETS